MTALEAFADLEIHISAPGTDDYPVHLRLNGKQEFPPGYLPADILPWKPSGDPASDGRRLLDGLLADPKLRSAWDRARGRAPRRRVRLWIDEQAPKVHTLPWELLHERGAWLAAQAATPFSRYLPSEKPWGGPVAVRPLRVLVAISSPDDLEQHHLDPLDVEQERAILEQGAQASGLLDLTFLEAPVTLERLEAALRQDQTGSSYHILHFLGHGAFSQRRDETGIYLQNEAGGTRVVTAQELVAMLGGLDELSELPRLVFLAACESATRSTTDAFLGLAPQLIRQAGVPAVVAMQDNVAVSTARKLGLVFYQRLAAHGVVDLALNEARRTLLTAGRPDAVVPVLFMRLEDGRLFDVVEARDVPFMAEDPPADFVHRPHEFDALLDALLGGSGERPVAITAALRGAGGYGKTTLATALCHDERVRAAFPDGVLWVTLGQEPKLVDGVVKLLRALTGERPAPVDVEDAAQELAQALGDKRYLLVIDDVWNQAHTRPFLRGGPHCTRLITTRNRDTLPPDTHTVNVDAMQPNEATQLLSAGLAAVGQDAILPRLLQLATQLGEWPLLLSLVNSALRRRITQGQSLANALTWVERSLEKRGLTAFDARDAQARDQAASLTLEVSLELLSEDERARYGELAVFPEDEDVPLRVVARLWGATGGLDDFDTEELCGQLFDLSLLRRFDLAARAVQLHDVVRDYLIRQQGDRLPTLHERLVQAYAATCQRGPDGAARWPTGPDDGYYFQHMVSHLHQAGRARCVWALLHATGVNALIADYDLPPVGGTEGGRKALHLVQGALRLSAHVLARDPAQLPGQMLGRLMSIRNNDIRGLTKQIENYRETPWLRPLTASLTPPGGPLLRTLTGHSQPVNAVAVTSDGRRVVSASADQTLKVWDLESGTELCTLAGHSEGVRAIAVMLSGRQAVSGSYDDTLKVWDLESEEELRTLIGHIDDVMAVVVTPDGRRVVSASRDQTLKVWDLESGTELCTLTGHSAPVWAVAVTPDGRRVVSASRDQTLKVWDLESGTELRTLTGHTGWIEAVAVTPDGQRAVSASFSTLKVWDLESGTELCTLTGHSAPVWAVAVTPDGRRVVSASLDHTLKVWDLESGEELRTLTGHSGYVCAVAVTPDGRRAVSASHDGTLKVWNILTLLDIGLESGEEVSEAAGVLTSHTDSVEAMAVTPDGRRAVSASSDETLKVWDLESGEELGTLVDYYSAGLVWAVAVTPDGRRAVLTSFDNTLKVWDLESGTELRTLTGHRQPVWAVAVTPDGRWVVSASRDQTLKVWDLESGGELRTLTGHSGSVWAVTVTPDGRRAVSASGDETLKVWDLESGEELGTLTGHTGRVNAVAVTPDGRWVVSASLDHTLKVWDLESEEELRTLTGHSEFVRAVVVTPDGRRAVSASHDQMLKVWDLESGKLIATFNADGMLYACAVAPDGGYSKGIVIVAGGASGRVHFLRLEGDESLRR